MNAPLLRHRLLRAFSVSCVLLLSACFGGDATDGGQDSSQNSSDVASSSSSVRETRNVTYRGTVEEAGISIYQQGSHRLTLEDGRFVLLESESVDLDAYVGQEAEVFGHLRPTVEAGGIIMRVERISSLETSSSSASSVSSRSSVSSAASLSPSSSSSSSSPGSSASSVSIVSSRSSMVSSAASSSAENVPGTSAGIEARIVIMAAHDLSPHQWTQRYCTDHIGFCIPVHRNWWFKSFGTTTSYLWHVEISTEEIAGLGDGPIHVNLVSGGVADQRASDREVRAQAGKAIGYRQWTDNRHFQIIADARLEAAVRYITENLAAQPST